MRRARRSLPLSVSLRQARAEAEPACRPVLPWTPRCVAPGRDERVQPAHASAFARRAQLDDLAMRGIHLGARRHAEQGAELLHLTLHAQPQARLRIGEAGKRMAEILGQGDLRVGLFGCVYPQVEQRAFCSWRPGSAQFSSLRSKCEQNASCATCSISWSYSATRCW